MAQAPKYERVIAYTLMTLLRSLRLRWATATYIYFLQRWGVNFTGRPAYISTRVDIDGTDYTLLTIGEGVTISSYVRVLTHDWSPHTVGKAMGIRAAKPLGRILPVVIGDYSFVGTGSILMPGAEIGCGCLIGAGTVVRGKVPDYSIVIGSPGKIVGDTRSYMARRFPKYKREIELAGPKIPPEVP